MGGGHGIVFTDRAVGQVKKMLAEHDEAARGLRVTVLDGGCAGFRYEMACAREAGPGDVVLEFDGLRVYVDAASGSRLRGARVDYIEGPGGSAFRIDNPNAPGAGFCSNGDTTVC